MEHLDEDLQLFDVPATARILGISEHTLRGWIAQARFPIVKVGGRVMVLKSDLREWIQARRAGDIEPVDKGRPPTVAEMLEMDRMAREKD